ncbi:MAG: hypothetical protein HYX39_10325 [Bacteroidetes bacterium]|nr:hypothetical protein [Bacteroidota bacterium]
MKFLNQIFFLLAVMLTFSGCKNDLKLNAPYKEIPSIYAVLNPQDKMQIIRINKVFLGESDAKAMAQVSDSINYKPGDLTITLKRFVSNVQEDASPGLQIITFRDSVLQSEPGVFNTNQRVYVTSSKLFTWGDYVLTVYNNNTKNTFTAKSAALDSVIPSGRPFTPGYYPVPPGSPVNSDNYIDYSNVNQTNTIRYKTNSAKIYQLLMRVHYYDSLLNGNSSNGYKNYTYADYAFTNQYPKDINPITNELSNTFKGQTIYNAIGTAMSKVPNNPDVIGRLTYKLQFFVFSSTQDYSDYLQFSAPSLSINQEKHIFSNFDNGAIGIFTFRARCSVMKELATSFKSQFATNPSTCSYKFFNASLSLPGCQ